MRSIDEHDIHSPFMFQLVTEVIYNPTPYYIYKDLELLRNKLLLDRTKIEVLDLGAGSSYASGNKRSIATICAQSVKKPKYAQLMFRLSQYFRPKNIIELGTSLGITTLYLSHSVPESTIYSIEGAPKIAEIAESVFDKYKRKNINLLVGEFEKQLPKVLETCSTVDMVFFDGNHKKSATLNYFELCLPKVHENTIFVFDDIHWSDEMEEAWNIICLHPDVSITADLFEMGLVFFKKRNHKEHFVIRF